MQVGVKGHVIPFELVIDYKLKDLKNNVIDKENRLNDIESRISELFDNLSEDEKTEIESILTEELEYVSFFVGFYNKYQIL